MTKQCLVLCHCFVIRHLSFVIRHSTFVLRHSAHALKKKIPVNTAFITSIASKACTTDAVVAWPTPSAPPSTFSPALHEMVIMIQAKTTLLIIPEYKSQASALSSARRMYPAVLKSSAETQTAHPPRMPM